MRKYYAVDYKRNPSSVTVFIEDKEDGFQASYHVWNGSLTDTTEAILTAIDESNTELSIPRTPIVERNDDSNEESYRLT